jgi:hypothetical protein
LRCDEKSKKIGFPIKPSSTRLLSVEYFATPTSVPLVLQFPKNMYMIDNELFSPGFVRRALEYHDDPFDFDLGYTLKIMDSELNIIEINRRQYILLGESSYSVENI